MEQKTKQLLFVYNANSGLGNALLDAAHKIINPATYECSLCQLTYGAVREKARWKKFREDTSFPMQFLHKDEFEREWGHEIHESYQFPAVFLLAAAKLSKLVGAEELNAMKSENELIHRIEGIINSLDNS